MSIIQLVNVTKIIGNNEILHNISLDIEKGKIHAFFGSNGSGKSMLFRVVCGLVKPSSGNVIVNGKTLHEKYSFPDNIGVIIESPGFWGAYSGFENLKMLASIKRQINETQIKEAISRVGLNPNDTRNYKKYSLGMKQRLAIAQAIMENPDILILDEPTNALDEDGVELVRSIIKEEQARGATVLLASHNKEDLDLLADYKYRMKSGNLFVEVGNE